VVDGLLPNRLFISSFVTAGRIVNSRGYENLLVDSFLASDQACPEGISNACSIATQAGLEASRPHSTTDSENDHRFALGGKN